MLPPPEVAKMERFYLPYLKVKSPTFSGDLELPIVMGVPLETTLSASKTQVEMESYLDLFKNEKYVLSCCSYVRYCHLLSL